MRRAYQKYEYSDDEIAEVLGIDRRTVSQIYRAAMQKIRIGLEERGISIDDLVYPVESP